MKNKNHFNINKFLKRVKKSYEITLILASLKKIILNLFSFNQYLFSDRTKLKLNKGLSGSDNPFSFIRCSSNDLRINSNALSKRG